MSNNVSDRYQLTELPNGTRVVSEYMPYVESFSLGFWFGVGARDESRRNNGIAHFLEHMLFKGTRKRSAKKISEQIESYGGYLNAFTSKEHTCFYGRGLVKRLDKTYDVLADMIENSLFRGKDLDREKGVVVDEMRDIEDNPQELIFDEFEKALFRGNALGLPIIGEERVVRNISGEDLRERMNRKYLPNNLVVACVGKIDHEKLVALTERYFGDKRGKASIRRKRPLVSNYEERRIEKEVLQSHCLVGRESFGYEDDRRYPLMVLSTALGEGSGSRLFQALRERLGVTYMITSFVNSYRETSSFGVYFSTNDAQRQKALAAIDREFRKLREKPLGKRELKRVKEYLKGSVALGLESASSRMFRLGSSLLRHGDVRPVARTMEKIDATTVEDVHELAKELLDLESMTKVFIQSGDNARETAA
ncbi:MAG: insulinase family protein [Ignavibacteriales bacterium]|nr:insulinase family protein [Ignavibacteriales bacterium]